MTEAEAHDWLRTHFGEAVEAKLARFVEMLSVATERQNLISAATLPQIWARHIVDSAQLVLLARRLSPPGDWIDVGTGAGLPGLVVAIAEPQRRTVLIEPRRKRVEFLNSCIRDLDLRQVEVVQAKIERLSRAPTGVISARAVAALPQLLTAAHHLARHETLWLLPKGASAQSEVALARKAWQGSFHVERSITHPVSQIIIATGVKPR